MTYTILSVFNILIAATMIVLILMQRGAGADAGAAFGGGSSGTVFGARGSATFLSRATGVLAASFFVISLSMGMILEHQTRSNPDQSLGVMAAAVQSDVPGDADGATTAANASTQDAGTLDQADTTATSTDVPAPAATGADAAASGDEAASGDTPAPQPAEPGSAD